MNKKIVVLLVLSTLSIAINAMETRPQRATWAFPEGQLTDHDSGFEQYDDTKRSTIKSVKIERSNTRQNPRLYRITRTFTDSQTGQKISQTEKYFRFYGDFVAAVNVASPHVGG